MAQTLLLIAFVCLVVVLTTGSYIALLVGAGALFVAWIAVVFLSSISRWPGGA